MLRLSGDELRNQMQYVRTFKKKIQYNQEFPLNAVLCEFYGILMGDGCISAYITADKIKRQDTVISGDKRYEEQYYLYIKMILEKNFGVNSHVKKYERNNSIHLIIRNKQFSHFLIRQGFPVGEKYAHLTVPEQFINLEWHMLKYLIRGLFDTDGTIFARKDEGYRYPHLGVSTKSSKLRNQLYEILRNRDYPVCFNGTDNLFLKGIKNVNRWMEDIGSSNPKHLFKYKYWKTHGILPARLLGG